MDSLMVSTISLVIAGMTSEPKPIQERSSHTTRGYSHSTVVINQLHVTLFAVSVFS